MDELKPASPAPRGVLFYVGAAGLLTTMAVESIAVIGRRTGMPVTGALEIAQAAIVPVACASMLIATLRGAHAAVHMITDRLPAAARRRVLDAGSLLAALCFAAVCAGSTWLAIDYWSSLEQTEVLHIPFRPLRAVVTLSAAALALVFVRRSFAAEHSA